MSYVPLKHGWKSCLVSYLNFLIWECLDGGIFFSFLRYLCWFFWLDSCLGAVFLLQSALKSQILAKVYLVEEETALYDMD